MIKMNKTILSFLLILSLYSSTYAFEGYYQNTTGGIELKMIAPENSNKNTLEMPTIDGDLKKILKQSVIISSDILGILVDGGKITIYFNRDSWTKIREFSSQGNTQKVAFIKNNKIISTPTMVSSIDRMAMLPIPEHLDMNWFLKGFTKKTLPEDLGSEEVYIQFMRNWVNNHPEDISALWTLAHHYVPETNFSNFENNFSGCEIAIPYLEKILIATPHDLVAGNKLIMCFLKAKDYEHALKTAEDLLDNLPGNFMKYPVIAVIGEIYYRSGRLEEAVQQIEIALKMCKESKISSIENWENFPTELKEKAKKQYQLGKDQAILIYEETIKRYKKELKEQKSRKFEM